MTSELAARIIAAAAALGDFRREDDAFIKDASNRLPDYPAHAGRLANELASLLAELQAKPQPTDQGSL